MVSWCGQRTRPELEVLPGQEGGPCVEGAELESTPRAFNIAQQMVLRLVCSSDWSHEAARENKDAQSLESRSWRAPGTGGSSELGSSTTLFMPPWALGCASME